MLSKKCDRKCISSSTCFPNVDRQCFFIKMLTKKSDRKCMAKTVTVNTSFTKTVNASSPKITKMFSKSVTVNAL